MKYLQVVENGVWIKVKKPLPTGRQAFGLE